MGDILDALTSTAYEVKDVTYETGNSKKVLGITGSVVMINSAGDEILLASVPGGDTVYSNAYGDFTATITNNTKIITIAALAFVLDEIHVMGGLILKKAVTTSKITIVPLTTVSVAAGVITLADADDFITGDEVLVFLSGPKKSYDATLDLQKVQEQSPLNEQYAEASIADTTNVATGTYYPAATGMPFGAYKNLSLTGKLIDGAGETTTLTIEATNDEDTTNADWIQIYMYDVKNNTIVNSIAATNETMTFVLAFDFFNFRHVRFLITATAATNTVIIKVRRSY